MSRAMLRRGLHNLIAPVIVDAQPEVIGQHGIAGAHFDYPNLFGACLIRHVGMHKAQIRFLTVLLAVVRSRRLYPLSHIDLCIAIEPQHADIHFNPFHSKPNRVSRFHASHPAAEHIANRAPYAD